MKNGSWLFRGTGRLWSNSARALNKSTWGKFLLSEIFVLKTTVSDIQEGNLTPPVHHLASVGMCKSKILFVGGRDKPTLRVTSVEGDLPLFHSPRSPSLAPVQLDLWCYLCVNATQSFSFGLWWVKCWVGDVWPWGMACGKAGNASSHGGTRREIKRNHEVVHTDCLSGLPDIF